MRRFVTQLLMTSVAKTRDVA